jgi:hypothetical protein
MTADESIDHPTSVRSAATLTGAVSRIIIMATRPTAVANSMYQAGASALPVAWISQVTISCAVPPKPAMATA